MGIANELSSDIASALLATKEKSPRQLKELKDTVLKVHLVLQEMTIKARTSKHPQPFVKRVGRS